MNKVTLMSLSLALVAGSIVLDVEPAQARDWGNGVNGRQARQHARIYNGVKNGSLTGRESARLIRQQAALNRQERFYRSTGNGLNNRERARLQHQQNQLSQNIYNQKHDGQDRNPGPGNGWGNPPGHGPGNPPGTNWNYRGVNARQDNQQDRIYNGVQSGELTQREHDRLQSQQESLAAREARMRASGGGLSLTERAKLDAQQDALSRNIARQKHDGQDNN